MPRIFFAGFEIVRALTQSQSQGAVFNPLGATQSEACGWDLRVCFPTCDSALFGLEAVKGFCPCAKLLDMWVCLKMRGGRTKWIERASPTPKQGITMTMCGGAVVSLVSSNAPPKRLAQLQDTHLYIGLVSLQACWCPGNDLPGVGTGELPQRKPMVLLGVISRLIRCLSRPDRVRIACLSRRARPPAPFPQSWPTPRSGSEAVGCPM